MGEEIATTVKTTSDGTVTIAVERYQELLTQAAAKPPVVHHHTTKTPSVAASDNKSWGLTLMGLGTAFFVVGAVRLRAGISQAAKLASKL